MKHIIKLLIKNTIIGKLDIVHQNHYLINFM